MNTVDIASANLACARSLLARLVRLGIRDVVVSSGARCAPLVLAVSDYGELCVWRYPDERSAAFFAMGATKVSRRPSVLICTSGTAGANYYPAIIESSLSHVPLIVLTADRPPELHGCGAPQTIDQQSLYGGYAKYSVTLAAPDGAFPARPSEWADAAESAFHEAVRWPAGPVHLNVPFHEPLLPDPDAIAPFDPPEPSAAVAPYPAGHDERHSRIAHPRPDWDLVEELAKQIAGAERCLLVAGPIDDPCVESLSQLSATTGFPLITDIASQLRCSQYSGGFLISGADLLVRNEAFCNRVSPDLVVRFGGLPTSKAFNLWLGRQTPRAHVIVADGRPIADPFRQSTHQIAGRPDTVAKRLVERFSGVGSSQTDYASVWSAAEHRLREILHKQFEDEQTLFDGAVVADVFARAPSDSLIMLGNSLPIRLADTYAAHRSANVRVIFNRGANGIDGVVSTAMGAAAASRRRVVLIIGDVSFMHDYGGLYPLLQRDLNLTVVLLNNDGGGIFSFLPLAQHNAIFESLIAMPHGRTFGSLAQFIGIRYELAATPGQFSGAFQDSLEHAGAMLIEVRTNRRQMKQTSDRIAQTIRELDLAGT
ncbi:MAG: 2-succinyl-5-enolpyruvyl-6-hydroxy-3-cyclohexene-1-carboxylic-acid synthase [Candidatus Zixiibacteriota bacterium]